MTTTAKSSGRLLAVDALRGAAVLAVVVTHLPYSLRTQYQAGPTVAAVSAVPPWFEHLSFYGAFGVHLFLVLSGFCIHIRWAKGQDITRGIDFLPFWKRRLWRLYPPYFVALLASLIGLFVLYGVINHTPRSAGLAAQLGYASTGTLIVDLVLLLLLMQNLNGASQRIGNGPFWSLALEEQLYLLYFPLLAVRRRWGWTAALGLAGAVSIGWRGIGMWLGHAPECWYVVGPSRWIEWCLGALVAEAFVGMIQLPAWTRSMPLSLGAFALGVALNPPAKLWHISWVSMLFGDFAFAVGSCILLNYLCDREKRVGLKDTVVLSALTSCGLWSYSIYLTHNPVIVAVKQVAVRLGLPVIVVLGLRFAAAVVVGYVFFRLIEKRFLIASRPVSREAEHST